jgi:DNA-binding MarR family transcriptional regulator
MSEVIEALESKGLIKRSQHPSHRRVFPATLTKKGERVLAACELLVDEMEAEMLTGLDAAERRLLRGSLIHAVRVLHGGLPET